MGTLLCDYIAVGSRPAHMNAGQTLYFLLLSDMFWQDDVEGVGWWRILLELNFLIHC